MFRPRLILPRSEARRRVAALLALAAFAALVAVAPPVPAADAIPGERWCDVPDGVGAREIGRIEFAGNRVTRDAVLERELVQRVGERCSIDRIVDGIQNVMDLGLFRSVRAELVLDDETLALRYTVREKYFFLAIPRLSRTADGELRGGLQLRWDNFSGRLHELRLTAERRREDDGRGREGYVRSIDYRVPRFLGSRWGLSVAVDAERRQVGFSRESRDFGEGERGSLEIGGSVSRWLGGGEGLRGTRAYLGVAFERRDLDLSEGDAGPFRSGVDTRLSVGLERREVHEEHYRRRGHAVDLSFTFGAPWAGSDFSHHRVDLELAWYRPLAGGIRNLNLRVLLGASDGAPFGGDAYAIGGGELLRGVAPGRDVGDVRAIVNAEYLAAFFTRPAWRWVAFADVGNVWPRERVRPFRLNLRGGLGLRYKLEFLTRTDLRLDLAWDPDEGKIASFVATSLTF